MGLKRDFKELSPKTLVKIAMTEDVKYIAGINSLIPNAWHEAESMVKAYGKKSELRPGTDGKPFAHCFLSEFFHTIMKERAIEAGLRK